ncbi:unnamed protein product [Gemmataceae bacterium]|nr:unnamed protein product [Gemmataceae bacterium]VTT98432.1 unnamed protein product [Gemmataceae bacterium]
MFPLLLLACCFFVVLLVPVALFVFTSVFRQACVLCGLPRPSVATAAGVMLLIWVSKTASQAVMDVIVIESCKAVGVPRWEANIIVGLLFLPIDLIISAALHAGLMNIKFGKGVEVWFVMMLIYLSVFALAGSVAAVIFVALN